MMIMIRTCGAQTAAFTKDFLDRMATPLAQGHCHDYQVMRMMMMMIEGATKKYVLFGRGAGVNICPKKYETVYSQIWVFRNCLS